MTIALTRTVRIRSDGVLEIYAPELKTGDVAEVIVLLESPEEKAKRSVRVEEALTLFRELQSLPQIRVLTDDEIAAEIAAYRAERR